MARKVTKLAALSAALFVALDASAPVPVAGDSSEVCTAPGCGGGGDVASLLQVKQEHDPSGDRYAGLGPFDTERICASVNQDPYAGGFNGQCCRGLHRVKGTWIGNYCSFRCLPCSPEGEDVKRFCHDSCGSCELSGDQIAPCCAGLDLVTNKNVPYMAICTKKHEDSRHIDKYAGLGPFDTERICASVKDDPYAGGFNGECCDGLKMILGQWHSNTCSFKCETCTPEGGDVFRFCGKNCGGCYKGGSEYAPCCRGLQEKNEGGKMICRRG